MVDFVLNAHRQQATAFQLERFAVAVERFHEAMLDAGDVFVKARHRQAAFLHGFRFAFEYGDFG